MSAEIFCGVSSPDFVNTPISFRRFKFISTDFAGRHDKEIGHDGSITKPKYPFTPPLFDSVLQNPNVRLNLLFQESLGAGYFGEYALVNIFEGNPTWIHFTDQTTKPETYINEMFGDNTDNEYQIPSQITSIQVIENQVLEDQHYRAGLLQKSIAKFDGTISHLVSGLIAWHDYEFIVIDIDTLSKAELISAKIRDGYIEIQVSGTNEDGAETSVQYNVNLNHMPGKDGLQAV